MQFIKSLFCRVGRDNGIRFFTINAACYLVSMLFIKGFAVNVWLATLFVFCLSSVVLLTSLRRSNDTQVPTKLLLLPSIIFILINLLFAWVNDPAVYWLLLISSAVVGLIALMPTQGDLAKLHYHFGYDGPVDLSVYAIDKPSDTNIHNRIEPSLVVTPNLVTPEPKAEKKSSQETAQSSVFFTGIQQQILQWINRYPRANVVAISVLFIFVAIIIFWPKNKMASEATEVAQTIKAPEPTVQKLHRLAMPDDYLLMLTSFDGLIMQWKMNTDDDGTIWSQETAQGEAACQNITFDNKEQIRVFKVVAEPGVYQAQFSPLDTAEIVKMLAAKNRFVLCGFEFSLKGSTATLSNHEKYSEWL